MENAFNASSSTSVPVIIRKIRWGLPKGRSKGYCCQNWIQSAMKILTKSTNRLNFHSSNAFVLVSVFSLLLLSCDSKLSDQFDQFAISKPQGSDPDQIDDQYPIERILTNQTGSQIKARILKRTSSQVVFERMLDGKRFSYPIALLSRADQDFLFGLPIPGSPANRYTSSSTIRSLEAELEDLMTQRNRLRMQIEDPLLSSPSPKRAGIFKDIQRIESQMIHLRLKIDELTSGR